MVRRASRGITSEMVAAVCKLMSNLDLIYAAKKIRVSGTLQHNDRSGREHFLTSAAQPYDRLSERHHGIRNGRLKSWLR